MLTAARAPIILLPGHPAGLTVARRMAPAVDGGHSTRSPDAAARDAFDDVALHEDVERKDGDGASIAPAMTTG